MFAFIRPTDELIDAYLSRQRQLDLSYDCVGCTKEAPVPRRGWNIDQHRVLLGSGERVFERAQQAIDQWCMFPAAMTTLYGSAPPHAGLTVAVLYRAAAACQWLLFPARIVYTFHDWPATGAQRLDRYGFAYGTLPDHPERGEERFLVEWNRADDTVWYDLLAVSQPAHWLARLGYPYARLEQARFRRLSGEAMQQAVRRKDEGGNQTLNLEL